MPGPEQIRYPLLLTLALARHVPPSRLAAFVAEHRGVHDARLAEYLTTREQALADGASATDLLTLDFGIRYETAVLDWFDHLPHELTGPGHAGGRSRR